MNRKLIYTFSLIGFFLMWGVFGFVEAGLRSQPVYRATVPESTPVVAQVTAESVVPVTGNPKLETEILLIYGVLGLGALILIIALLNAANKPTALYARRKDPPEEP